MPLRLHPNTVLQADDEYMISDYDLPTNRFVSVPKSYGSFHPGAMVAGMIRGMLDAAGFAARCGGRQCWGRKHWGRTLLR